VSGSAWELEIGTERFQDKENNVVGDDEINQVKIHKCMKKRVPKHMYLTSEVLEKSSVPSPHLQTLQFYDCENANSENVRCWS